MISVCFYFEVHQPYRLRPYNFFDIGHEANYFDDVKNEAIARKVAEKCYLPMTSLLLDMIRRDPEFKVTFAISGVAMEQFRDWCPEVRDNFRRLADTGNVEFLAETYYHSLSALYSDREFSAQVEQHIKTMRAQLGVTPTAFRNTELIFNNHVAYLAYEMGFSAILLEGAEKILQWRSPNFLYQPRHSPGLKCLLKNYRLSDDIAFRFSDRNWAEWPLNAEKFAWWAHAIAGNGTTLNLFMDFETFGEHQWADTGIFDFMRALPDAIRSHPDFEFRTVSEVARRNEPVGDIETDEPVSWADAERDLSAWRGNGMQHQALESIYELEDVMYERIEDPALWHIFRKLQTSDHFYYMCTKYFEDGDVHKYFSPYSTPHDAYIYYMNVLQDFRSRLKRIAPGSI